jgi:mitochondrial import receptor subunit TOM40
MGSMEIPAQGSEVIKIPTSNYEFGANFINPRVVLLSL